MLHLDATSRKPPSSRLAGQGLGRRVLATPTFAAACCGRPWTQLPAPSYGFRRASRRSVADNHRLATYCPRSHADRPATTPAPRLPLTSNTCGGPTPGSGRSQDDPAVACPRTGLLARRGSKWLAKLLGLGGAGHPATLGYTLLHHGPRRGARWPTSI